jgi:hypothetical protein
MTSRAPGEVTSRAPGEVATDREQWGADQGDDARLLGLLCHAMMGAASCEEYR